MCKTMFERKPKTIRTDRDNEYMEKEFFTYLKTHGQQNGVGESKNRTLKLLVVCACRC